MFIDSGVDTNFMDDCLFHQLGLSHVPLLKSVPARALDVHLLGTVTVTDQPHDPIDLTKPSGDTQISHHSISRGPVDFGLPLDVTP